MINKSKGDKKMNLIFEFGDWSLFCNWNFKL